MYYCGFVGAVGGPVGSFYSLFKQKLIILDKNEEKAVLNLQFIEKSPKNIPFHTFL